MSSRAQSKLWRPASPTFLVISVLLIAFLRWPQRWLLSGAPILTLLVIHGATQDRRIFPFLNLWALLATINLLYAICATSWLLYRVFTLCCYPAIVVLCLRLFRFFADIARKALRSLLTQVHFINDKIAFFDIPSLKIDTEVDGLMVIRGITFTLSSLKIVAHGVEVGIKLSEDMELSVQTETVTIALLQSINIGDVYANLKGGPQETSFGYIEDTAESDDGEPVVTHMATETSQSKNYSEKTEAMRDITGGTVPENVSTKEGLESVTTVSPGEEMAGRRYSEVLQHIEETNAISQSRKLVRDQLTSKTKAQDVNANDKYDIRAAVCSQLHGKVSVRNPPLRSIKVTTLQQLAPPRIRRFLHRLPMLLRLLLTLLSYMHTITISSITAAGSGQWIKQTLNETFFKHHVEESHELRSLQKKVSDWLYNANFVITLANITARARVPFLPAFDIGNQLNSGEVMLYRALPEQTDLKQVVCLRGADLNLSLPSYLLPHHEHLLPTMPMDKEMQEQLEETTRVEGMRKPLSAEHDLVYKKNDETKVSILFRLRLPATFDQELLNFIAALVKATKVIEIEKRPGAFEGEMHEVKEYSKALRDTVVDKVKKTSVDVAMSETWIAKLVGKAMKSLEHAEGEVGYAFDVPIPLKPYRDAADTASKLLE